MMHRGRTPAFEDATGTTVPGSVAEITPYTLGGLEQWIMIRGASIENPALVLVHGGPGFPEMRLFRHFNSALENMFTVVYWEQRGTGKSYSRRARRSPMTVERFVNDLDELVDRVRDRLGKDTVTIYGHSWGSALGVLYTARFPEKVTAYVGTGQIGDWPASERMTYEFTLAEAERRGNERAVRQLRDVGPPPHTAKQMEVQRKWLTRFVGIARGKSLWEILRVVLGGPESSVFDLSKLVRGMRFSGRAMWAEVSQLNLELLVPEVRVPVFFFPGRHDRVVDPRATVAYFDRLIAPTKRLLWFEQSSHEPPIEEPDKFHRAMAELVRPISESASVRNDIVDHAEGGVARGDFDNASGATGTSPVRGTCFAIGTMDTRVGPHVPRTGTMTADQQGRGRVRLSPALAR